VKPVVLLLAALACLCAAPALAQPGSGHYDAARLTEPGAQALAFIRIPFGQQNRKHEPVIGFGLFANCTGVALRHSAARRQACDAAPIRSLEVSRKISDTDWLIAFRGERRWVGIARLYPDGFASTREYGPILSEPGLADMRN
jgi:hypothetical protein